MPAPSSSDWILVTGATGFVGAALVHELLSRGHRVLCLVRAASPGGARERLVAALRTWTTAGEHLLETGRLAALRGDIHTPDCGLSDNVCDALRGRVPSLVHSAGNTRFTADADGEPELTNLIGTRNVLTLAQRLECREWHHISTAYVAGAAEEAREEIAAAPPVFHNAYERSKWEAEQLATTQARQVGATLTIYRPSVVVGHSESGLTSHFAGIYYMFRAVSLLARAAAQQPELDRHAIPLRIPAEAEKQPNLVCIDDVANAFVDLFENTAVHGNVYHLTHPVPPTNAQIKRVLEACYDIGGGRFTGGAISTTRETDEPQASLHSFQKMFDEMTLPLREYLFDAPRFSRTCIDSFVSRKPAPWTDERLRRLITAAEAGGWRAGGYERQAAAAPDAIGIYFSEFLPARMAESRFARVENLELTVRFEIGKQPHGRWWYRFRGGRVEDVAPAGDQAADVTYRTSESRFWAAVAGEITAAELFLAGEAQVEGDIERALKFAMLLEEFVHEHPYRRTNDAPIPVEQAS